MAAAAISADVFGLIVDAAAVALAAMTEENAVLADVEWFDVHGLPSGC